MVITYYQVWADMYGGWDGSYTKHGAYLTKKTAKAYCDEWVKKNNYHPLWKITKETQIIHE